MKKIKQLSGSFLWIMLALALGLGLSLSFQSCINDDLSGCVDPPKPPPPPVDSVKKVRVFFDYEESLSTASATNEDEMAIESGIRLRDLESVSQLDLYIFSAKTGLFIEKQTDRQPYLSLKATYCVELELPVDDSYRIVAWGGLQKSDFAVAPVTPIKNSSRFEDFLINYHFQGDTIVTQIENLYYGMIEAAAPAVSDSFRMRLRQDTYAFNIKLAGTAVRRPGISDTEIHAVISDNNSTYNFNNIPVSGPTHCYKTLFEQNTEGEWFASRSTLLVDEYRRPVLRFFRNGAVWKLPGMTEGIDLINLLQHYAEERRIMLDFSTMYVFNLKFTINVVDPGDETSLSVGVDIGDWHFVPDDKELHM
ncbi:MAG: FimB/Mfa2 family fimbrial subunit [Tannerella sp.]|nr:FimB/Mfa2 family fimbrial subunit [Tannerella sp.]